MDTSTGKFDLGLRFVLAAAEDDDFLFAVAVNVVSLTTAEQEMDAF